jgi:hypothetical protein
VLSYHRLRICGNVLQFLLRPQTRQTKFPALIWHQLMLLPSSLPEEQSLLKRFLSLLSLQLRVLLRF